MGNLTNLKTNKTIFIPCDCTQEILYIEYDHELKLADLAIFSSINSVLSNMSWCQKIKYIWKVLVNHTPYTDQIILNKKQLKELKDFLSSVI